MTRNPLLIRIIKRRPHRVTRPVGSLILAAVALTEALSTHTEDQNSHLIHYSINIPKIVLKQANHKRIVPSKIGRVRAMLNRKVAPIGYCAVMR